MLSLACQWTGEKNGINLKDEFTYALNNFFWCFNFKSKTSFAFVLWNILKKEKECEILEYNVKEVNWI